MEPGTRALLFLSLIAALAVIWLAHNLRSKRYSIAQWCLWAFCLFVTRVLWCVNIPRIPFDRGDRGLIFVANHRSSIDPFYIQSRLDRPMHWMVAREFCEHWAFRWFLRQCEVIPVNRGGVDTKSTKRAIELARQGRWVGIFPEGRINQTVDEFMLSVRPGVIVTARRANALIVPCYIHGSPYDKMPWSPFFMAARVHVAIGHPIDIQSRYGDSMTTEQAGECMREVVEQIAHMAGRDDFEVELAGRRWKDSAG